jgi:hypothetical protein
MSGYLEAYGAGEEKRFKLIKRIVLVAVIVLAAGAGLYYFFHNYRETKQARLFLELLKSRDYQAAYALWGCTPDSPCRAYAMDKFMEDWGPKSPYSDASKLRITETRGCSAVVMFKLETGTGKPEYLVVDRAKKNLGYAPLADLFGKLVCDPRVPNSSIPK